MSKLRPIFPRDVVEIRDNAAVELLEIRQKMNRNRHPSLTVRATEKSDEVVSSALLRAPIFYVTRDMADMLYDTAKTVPEFTPAACLPAPTGFVWFQKPALHLPSGPMCHMTTSPTIPIDYMHWVVDGTRVFITAGTVKRDFIRSMSKLATSLMGRDYHVTTGDLTKLSVPLNEAMGGGKEAPFVCIDIEDDHPFSRSEINSVSKTLGALWLLMAQKNVVDTADTAIVKKRTKKVRKLVGEKGTDGTTVIPEVTVTTCRISPVLARRATGTGAKATRRWWVRGHWRQQAYGPGRTQRKPIYIAPHTAGAKNGQPDGDVPQTQKVVRVKP